MQDFSKKRLLRTENKSFFDLSIYEYIGYFGVLKSEIKKLILIITGAGFRAPLLCFVSHMITARNLAKFL